ncbi:MAG: hypothetical protein JSS76_18100 [Bacteroidetes bacterium]|nr:hypothetical protein [Bacteroidota bacterium]
MRLLTIITLIIALAAAGCKAKQHTTTTATADTHTAPVPPRPATYRPTAHAIVYKTKGDYTQYVPVTLTDDGTSIASYPDPSDVYYQGKIATPTLLADGYLLDNRGLTPHSAFIRITYEDYAKLKEVPSVKELNKLVIDRAPFTEMYDLGERNQYPDLTGGLNTIIKGGRLTEYRKLL